MMDHTQFKLLEKHEISSVAIASYMWMKYHVEILTRDFIETPLKLRSARN